MKKKLLSIAFLSAIVICYLSLSSNNNGKTGVSTSGCGSCHGNTAKAATIISTTFDGGALTSYTPGQKYAVELTLSNSTSTLVNAGFDAAFTKGVISNALSGTAISSSKLEIYHTTPKNLTSGTVKWTFDWTAPAAGSGSVTFNIAGNVCNGDNKDNSSDAWNKSSLTLTEGGASTALAPTISNINTSNVLTTSASVNAKVNANNSATTTLLVEYGKTTSYGSTQNLSPSSVSGSSLTSVTAALSGLTSNTTYHFRIKAINSVGTTLSADSTFTTKSSSNITSNSVEKNINIFPNPAKDYIILESENALNLSIITVFNLEGKHVNLDFYYINPNKIKVNTSSLRIGKYFLNLTFKNGEINKENSILIVD